MVKWRNGEMAKWRNGEMVKWRNGEMVNGEFSLFSRSLHEI